MGEGYRGSEERMLDSATEEINPKKAVVRNKNKSCFFILPLLGYNSHWYYGLLNCYLGDINKPEFVLNKIFIQLKVYDRKLLGLKHFNQYYQLEDSTYMYVFDIPVEFEEDYNNFIEGKYSRMSDKAKQIIVNASGIKPIMNSIVYKVLFRTADQKKSIEELIGEKLPDNAEVYSVPNMDKEIYTELSIKRS